MSVQAQLDQLPPPVAMLQMIQGFWVSRQWIGFCSFNPTPA